MRGICEEYSSLIKMLVKGAPHHVKRPFFLFISIYRLNTTIRSVFQLSYFDIS
jgi:hypothetical protein